MLDCLAGSQSRLRRADQRIRRCSMMKGRSRKLADRGTGVLHMKFPRSTVVEKAERRVASLLDFRNDKSRTDGMDRAGRDENDVVLPDSVPLNQVRNRAVLDRGPQLPGCEPPLQSDGNFGARC